jgi:hypothetical protein
MVFIVIVVVLNFIVLVMDAVEVVFLRVLDVLRAYSAATGVQTQPGKRTMQNFKRHLVPLWLRILLLLRYDGTGLVAIFLLG